MPKPPRSPRIEYDEDDDAGADHGLAGPDWRRRLLTWGLAAVGLGLGFLIPYTLYLNHQVGERFGQLRWQVPTRVYARPLVLRPGLAMDAQTLKTELDASAYRDDGAGVRPGTYSRNGGRWLIASRGYYDVDGKVAPRRIEVVLSGSRVASVRDAARKQSLKAARLDPARIATLYGQQQEERRLVRIEEVPELLVTGLQAVEDRDFNHHHGIDLSGIARAAWVNLRSGEARQGASTITQQLARTLFLTQERTVQRKIKEILLAIWKDTAERGAYVPSPENTGRRSLRYAALGLLAAGAPDLAVDLIQRDLATASNMTAEIGALTAILGIDAPARNLELENFHTRHAGDHLLQHQRADHRARRAGGRNRAGGGPGGGGGAAAPVASLVTGLVPWAASRYIAAHDDCCRQHLAPPPPYQQTGARLIFVVPPEKGPRHVFPIDDPRWLP